MPRNQTLPSKTDLARDLSSRRSCSCCKGQGVSHFGKEVVASPGPAQTTERRQVPGFPLFTPRPRRHLGSGLENRQPRTRLLGSNPTPFAFWAWPFPAAPPPLRPREFPAVPEGPKALRSSCLVSDESVTGESRCPVAERDASGRLAGASHLDEGKTLTAEQAFTAVEPLAAVERLGPLSPWLAANRQKARRGPPLDQKDRGTDAGIAEPKLPHTRRMIRLRCRERSGLL
jgi:hypothetical protein